MNHSKLMLFVVFIISCTTLSLSAQLDVRNQEFFRQLKNTTTIVFMPVADTFKHQAYREILEEHWTLTPIRFISYNQYVKHKNQQGYSYLLFGDDKISTSTSTSTYVYLELWTWHCPDGNWDNKKKKLLARMELFSDPKTTYDPSLIYDYRFNTEGHIFNWSPGLMKNYIQMFQNFVNNNQERMPIRATTDWEQLSKLENKTLHIPDYVLKKFNGSHVYKGEQSKNSLLQYYPYSYKIVSNEELSQKILEAKEATYYLLYVRSNSDKYISIVEAQTGHIIYSRYLPLSFNLVPRDFKKLGKAIQKAKK